MARNIWGTRIPEKRNNRYSKVKLTKADMYLHYFKLFMILVVGYIYLHFIVMGWHL